MEVVVVQSPEPDGRHAMRLTTRMSFATLIGLCLVLALAPGCASRKKVTPEANVPPPETESTAPAPPEKGGAPAQDKKDEEPAGVGPPFFLSHPPPGPPGPHARDRDEGHFPA